jgi:hypothetical protein
MALALFAAVVALSGCASTPSAFPANEKARVAGNLRIKIVRYGTTSGPVTVWMPDGEVLQGRWSVIVGGAVGFGSTYASVYGSGGFASGSGFHSAMAVGLSAPGVADAVGPSGRTVHCEVMSSGAHGNGACETSDGALYRVQF